MAKTLAELDTASVDRRDMAEADEPQSTTDYVPCSLTCRRASSSRVRSLVCRLSGEETFAGAHGGS